jgi:hypothetical protein
MILAAYQYYRGVVEGVYPDLLAMDRVLHLDHPQRVASLVQGEEQGEAVQLYVPNLLASEASFNTWSAQVDVLASTVNNALILADKLTTALQPVPGQRNPNLNNRPVTETRGGPGYGLTRVSFRFLKAP